MKNKLYKILLLILCLFVFSYNIFALEEKTDEVKEEEIKEVVEEKTDEVEDNIYVNPKTGYKAIIEDDALLLDKSVLKNLENKMIELTEYGNIMFKTTEENSGYTSSYAERYYHSKFGTSNGSLLLIDMKNREIYIFSDGNNYKVITSSKAYSITDNVYRYAKSGQYFKCAYEAFDEMLTLLNGSKIMEPMRYISNILISITCAAFLNFFFVVNRSKIKKASDKEIIEKAIANVSIGNVDATKTGTTREYRPVSSSSGSHSSGHSGGGGHFGGGGGGHSGGGGGHRF